MSEPASLSSPFPPSVRDDLSRVLPMVAAFTLLWTALFLSFQRVIIPFLLRLWPAPLPAWWSALTPQKRDYYVGRVLFAFHHLLVAYYALLSLLPSSSAADGVWWMRLSMYHEIACDVFDVVVIALTDRGFTGLNWQGLLLHHLLSILCILVAFTIPTQTAVIAQLAVLLDGTGATDYLFSTVLAHTPLLTLPAVLLTASAATALFFLSRLLYFPYLALLFVLGAWQQRAVTGVVCLLLMLLTCFFNVGMIRTRWKQYRRLWAEAKGRQKQRQTAAGREDSRPEPAASRLLPFDREGSEAEPDDDKEMEGWVAV